MAGTTADKLQGIIDAKADIASAITTKGGTVPTLFADYGDAIRDLPSGSTPVICGLNVTPTTSAQTITAPSGTDGYSPVNVSAVTSSIDQNISAGNIKSGVSILGVTGTYEGSGGGGGDNKLNQLLTKTITTVTAEDMSGVTSIESYVFNDCSGLTSVPIPNAVTSIGAYAFNSCTGLTSITIPSGVTSIGDYAFSLCRGLTGALTIPNAVTSIGQNAFRDCTGFTSLTIGSGVTSLGTSVFLRCTGFTSVTIPSTVTSISTSSFQGCTGLTSITIGGDLRNLGQNAFRDCTNCLLFDFRSATQVPTLSNTNTFQNTNANKKIVVPDNLYDSWKAANNWKSTTYGIVDAITRASDYNP